MIEKPIIREVFENKGQLRITIPKNRGIEHGDAVEIIKVESLVKKR